MGVLEGILKGFSADRYEDPSRPLQEPFRDLLRNPFRNPSKTLLGSGAAISGPRIAGGQFYGHEAFSAKCGVQPLPRLAERVSLRQDLPPSLGRPKFRPWS